jgi:hypothetical protein
VSVVSEAAAELELMEALETRVDVLEIAWAAGLFEGEGSISTRRAPSDRVNKTFRTYPELCLDSTDEDVVVRFAAAVGGGRVYGPYRATRPNHKPRWRCVLVGQAARAALELIGPYLCERRTARMHEVLALSDEPIRKQKRRSV